MLDKSKNDANVGLKSHLSAKVHEDCLSVCACSYCVPSPHNYSHLNAFECTLALQQGGIKPKRLPLYNAACICRQAAEQRDCPGLKLVPHTADKKKRRKEGKRRRLSSLSFVCDSLFASRTSASGFRPARALGGGVRPERRTDEQSRYSISTKAQKTSDFMTVSSVFTGFSFWKSRFW